MVLGLLGFHGPLRERAATLFGANVSLMHAFNPASHNGFELYLLRGSDEIAEEHQTIGRDRLNSFLQAEFPISKTQGSSLLEMPQRRSLRSRGRGSIS